jgi:hypothetical protein
MESISSNDRIGLARIEKGEWAGKIHAQQEF